VNDATLAHWGLSRQKKERKKERKISNFIKEAFTLWKDKVKIRN
jgi:hypothetical protein